MDIPVLDHAPDERAENLRMISESAAGLLQGDRRRARALRFSDPGFEHAKWAALAEMGWLMLRLPQADDGLGMGLSELCVIARQTGRELVPEPVVMAALIAPALPLAARDDLLACRRILLPAFAQPSDPLPVLRDGRVSGRVRGIPMAAGADGFLVQTGSGAALVDSGAAGMGIRLDPCHDGSKLGSLTLTDTPAETVATDMIRLREEAMLALAAELLGVAETAFDLTLAYLKERRQFDKPIGAFQALQHSMVDLFMELSLMRATVGQAATRLDDGATGDSAAAAVSVAKARCTEGASRITRAAIQLHGGIGYTDEADIGLYLRKAMVLGGLLGGEAFHRARALSLAEAAQ